MGEARQGLRFSFNAAVEIAPERTPNATVVARMTELSLQGCFVEHAAPFPEGTLLLVKIFHEEEYFEAKAKVVHVKKSAGMGLTFRDVNPYCQSVLHKWILAAMRRRSDAMVGTE
jgi:PilZ domain-containing protein